MSYNTFTLALKSTIDYQAKLLADSKNLPFVDLDSANFDPATFESDQPAVCWEFSSLIEDPFDPMWLAMFEIGVVTGLDPAQYASLDLVSMFLNTFKARERFQIKDYSGVSAPSVVLGSLYIVSSGVTPQQQDRAAGVRFISVTARAFRNG